MSTLNGGPGKIITNGLVLYLDAANPTYAPSRNLLNNTTDLTNAASWIVYNSSLTSSAATAPDGTNSAYAWNIATSGTSSVVRLAGQSNNAPVLSAVSGGQYIFSVHVKNKNCTATDFNLSIYNGAYTIGNEPIYSITSSFTPVGANPNSATFANGVRQSQNVGNNWYRISYATNVTSSLSSFNIFFDIESGGGTKIAGEGIYIWGPQFETGASPTRYQPIVSTTKTWPSITGQSLNASLFNNVTYTGVNAGTMVFNGVNQYASATISLLPSFSFCMVVNKYTAPIPNESFISTSGNNNRFQFNSPSSSFSWRYRAADGSYSDFVSSNNYITLNTWNHITVTYDGSTVNFYKNSVLTNTFTSASMFEGFGNTVTVGGNSVNSVYFNGAIPITQIYNRALSQVEITQNFNTTRARFGI